MFTFDHTFDKNCRQDELYEKCCKEVLESLMKGFNCTIFAYGQTGTGKTYTMGGNEGEKVELTRWESFQEHSNKSSTRYETQEKEWNI